VTWLAAKDGSDVGGDLMDRLLGQAPRSTRARHYQAPSLDSLARAIRTLDFTILGLTLPPTEPKDHSEKSVHEKRPGSKTSRNEEQDSSRSTMTIVAVNDDDPAENKADQEALILPPAHLAKPSYVGSNPIHASEFAGVFGPALAESSRAVTFRRVAGATGSVRTDSGRSAAGGTVRIAALVVR
jgi:hypothetical protein